MGACEGRERERAYNADERSRCLMASIALLASRARHTPLASDMQVLEACQREEDMEVAEKGREARVERAAGEVMGDWRGPYT